MNLWDSTDTKKTNTDERLKSNWQKSKSHFGANVMKPLKIKRPTQRFPRCGMTVVCFLVKLADCVA
jgi:hypothetical protein